MSRGVVLIYSLVLLTSVVIILSQSPFSLGGAIGNFDTFSSALEELFQIFK